MSSWRSPFDHPTRHLATAARPNGKGACAIAQRAKAAEAADQMEKGGERSGGSAAGNTPEPEDGTGQRRRGIVGPPARDARFHRRTHRACQVTQHAVQRFGLARGGPVGERVRAGIVHHQQARGRRDAQPCSTTFAPPETDSATKGGNGQQPTCARSTACPRACVGAHGRNPRLVRLRYD